jgi:UDP-glucose 4-epimerase
MKVFITGGAGFIGSHLCDALVAEGKEVTILDNLSTGSKKNIAHLEGKIKVFQGDIRDQILVESLVEDCDLVLHMAAALGVDNILENPIESISTNYHGSEVVLNAATKYDRRIVIASTSEIYGKNPKQPLSETDDRVIGAPQKFRWTYSDAKALEEATAHALFLKNNLRVTTVRLFNTVGPRQTGKHGMVLPRFVKAAKNNELLNIHGDGKQSRVFCHVKDSVSAIIKLTQLDNSVGQVFNIGGLEEISILNLANLVIKLTGSKSTLSLIPYSEAYSNGYEDMKRRVPDITKIRNFTGWEPKNSLSNIISDIQNSID